MTSELHSSSVSFLQDEITGALAGYEVRLSQAEMMDACSEVIEEGGILIVEAGTGTGKTFAYLIPAVLSGKKVIVSTRTKNLQEQLVGKDLRFLASLKDFDYALAKGRSNYLCLRRLHAFTPTRREEVSDYEMFVEWASETGSGDFEDFHQRNSALLERFCSDSDACRKSRCQYYGQCFYFRARATWNDAQILVVNHALFSINALMPDDSKILPGAQVLIIDEAHALDNIGKAAGEDVAREVDAGQEQPIVVGRVGALPFQCDLDAGLRVLFHGTFLDRDIGKRFLNPVFG